MAIVPENVVFKKGNLPRKSGLDESISTAVLKSMPSSTFYTFFGILTLCVFHVFPRSIPSNHFHVCWVVGYDSGRGSHKYNENQGLSGSSKDGEGDFVCSLGQFRNFL